jgi:histone acetyltransferase SAS3
MTTTRSTGQNRVEEIACEYGVLLHTVQGLTNARFCGQDEENDPSEDFEEYLTCAVCGDNCMLFPPRIDLISLGNQYLLSASVAHRQCAREQGALNDAEGTLYS